MQESLLEFEGELEGEWEGEFEGEYEGEEFLGTLTNLARRAAASPALRRLAAQGARAALSGLAAEFENEYEGEWEGELEGEFEEEGEWEVNPIRRVYPQGLMEHLAHAAAATESEAEAEAFVGALVPLAARMLPRVAPAMLRAAPRLIRGMTRVARVLRRNRRTRPLVRTLPRIMQQTARRLARQQAAGRPVTPQRAVRTLAQQTRQVLGSPQQCVRAVRRSQAIDRRYHRLTQGRSPRLQRSPRARRVMAGGSPVGARIIGGPRVVRRATGYRRRPTCPTCGGRAR